MKTLLGVTLLACTMSVAQSAHAQSVAQFKQVLRAQLQALRPQGYTERNVLFQDVRAGKPNGGYYPFVVTLVMRDYEPGYPKNNYFGNTCVSKMDGWKFDMLKDATGTWIVQGRMTVSGATCTKNPAAGVSSVPVASLPGQPAEEGSIAESKVPKQDASAAGNLYVGEYACYGTGGRLMAGMGFRLTAAHKYADLDGQRGGSYVYDAGKSTIGFHGGYLDGQVGSHVVTTGFQLSSTVNCEPWR